MGILAALIALITTIDTEGRGPSRENIPDIQSLLGRWDCPLVCVEARPGQGGGCWSVAQLLASVHGQASHAHHWLGSLPNAHSSCNLIGY